MGHKNQLFYLQRMVQECRGDVLEVGSKNHGNGNDFKSLFNRYVGLDLEEGENVDIVHNLEDGPLSDKFDLIICCSVLEHTPRPWVVAENITKMLNPGGKLYVSVPWVQRYHPYPEDYYRFSFPGIRSLFSQLTFIDAKLSTFAQGEFMDLLKYPDIDSRAQCLKDNRPHLPCLELHAIGYLDELRHICKPEK